MKKKTIIRLTAIVAIASIIAGFTLAYLTDVTSAKTNTFTASNGIDIQLAEPNFDNIPFTGESAQYADNTNAALGMNRAKNMVPGRVIPKNPMVININDASDPQPVWVAVKLTYSGTADTYDLIDAFAQIDLNATDWYINADKTVFYYKTTLANAAKTNPIFTTITIDSTALNSSVKDFVIDITAYAVQAESINITDLTSAQTIFHSAFPSAL